ncbi:MULTISPECIES: carbohydrate ABC transporter permease [Salimicrobium]|uniref:N-acetylglucosamine ABC transporter permease n=4 Tax=Salimicrobium TaxID=351195 RepID=K2GCN0_9BACI|nr:MULTISPECIES: carbohydrate ABC transporter permease [Salimicrobium]AKG03538.1 sugar ABC transporter permease [Salimicrobium jeotgali]EKE32027.1 N-acetylglucosamine ABC transporter permease [Salimicrobium jeotgali]MBM7695993.1 N-acetylglucosamine transport system permease protein [Salimicrobium jeotgali]PBB07043.1 carbohydrate ABC transporter permease [Salimicrobium humidisoli]SDX86405.1 N-acetylglucosamine transport system permease protein [Salimicrobium album]
MKRKQGFWTKIGVRIPLVLWSLAVLYPILWMILGAFKSNAEIYANPWGLPDSFSFGNFIDAWSNYNIDISVFNSLIVTGLGALLTLVMAIPTAYALERLRFRGNRLLFTLYISAMMIPMVLGWIPLFFLLMQLNLLDNIFGLAIVYAVSQLPFSIFVLTSFMATIPKSLEEAAAIDGMSPYKILWKIITPLSMTGIITVTIMNMIQFWNEYFMALIFLQSENNYTLALAIDYISNETQYTNSWGTLFASLVIAIVPVIILYAIFQRRIVKGMTEGAIKG